MKSYNGQKFQKDRMYEMTKNLGLVFCSYTFLGEIVRNWNIRALYNFGSSMRTLVNVQLLKLRDTSERFLDFRFSSDIYSGVRRIVKKFVAKKP